MFSVISQKIIYRLAQKTSTTKHRNLIRTKKNTFTHTYLVPHTQQKNNITCVSLSSCFPFIFRPHNLFLANRAFIDVTDVLRGRGV